jgi:XTP/dITP diphosphohydrolase
MHEIIVATANKGKVREFRDLLADMPFAFSTLADHWDPLPSIAETGTTFEQNALLKARWVMQRKGGWVLADDSGLEVDYLQGAPGVYSARYAGEGASDSQNRIKLLDALQGVALAQRTARFRCVLVLLMGSEDTLVAQGVCEGHIAEQVSGEQGFGYDSLFVPQGYDKTFGQLDASIKHTVSHRGAALLKLRSELGKRYA